MNQPTQLDNSLSARQSLADVQDEKILDVVIVGAGIAGLTAANELSRHGYRVAVYEKARGTGGRMSSKRVALDDSQFMSFDLGCASFSASSEEFKQQISQWHSDGVIAPWWKDSNGNTHYVGIPRSSSITRHLSKNVACYFKTKIGSLTFENDVWNVVSDESDEIIARAKQVVLATPPDQAYDLLPESSLRDCELKQALDCVSMNPQWVMGVEVDQLPINFPEVTQPKSDIILSISHESIKPHRDSLGKHVLQVQATVAWTQQHLEVNKTEVSEILQNELSRYFSDVFDSDIKINHSYLHRWLYSQTQRNTHKVNTSLYLSDESGISLIGDYIDPHTRGVESSWMSGYQLSKHLIEKLSVRDVFHMGINKIETHN